MHMHGLGDALRAVYAPEPPTDSGIVGALEVELNDDVNHGLCGRDAAFPVFEAA